MAGDQIRKFGPDLELATRSRIEHGRLPKWPKGADCKSAGGRLRRFESFTAHLTQADWDRDPGQRVVT